MKKSFFDKLQSVANRVAREKGLDFFAVAHPLDGLYDRWDLLVSSPNLEPWRTDALRYIAKLLQKSLTVADMVRIAQIVVLPVDHDVIQSLVHNDLVRPGKLSAPLDGEFDRVFVFRPAERQGPNIRPASARGG